MSEDFDDITTKYEKRKLAVSEKKNKMEIVFNRCMVEERNEIYAEIISRYFRNPSEIKILEIGAGSGGNIIYFQSLGVKPENCFANDIIPERAEQLNSNLPGSTITSCNALDLDYNNEFDIVFQSTVFTSVQKHQNRELLVDKMCSMVKSDGILLWYDFLYDNPKNKDVSGISKRKTISLFKNCNLIYYKKVTLAPPIGRRVGRFYRFFNFFPFLRSHCIAVFKLK